MDIVLGTFFLGTWIWRGRSLFQGPACWTTGSSFAPRITGLTKARIEAEPVGAP